MKKKILLVLLSVSLVAPFAHALSLAWDPDPAQDNVTGYNVYEDMGGGVNVKLGNTASTTWPLGAIAPGSHTYFVTAFNATGESGPSNTATALGVPHVPTNLKLQ